MSLRLLTPNCLPYGAYDGYDSEYLVLKGGEVVSFTTVSVSGSDLAAKDAFNDGYSNPSGVEKRVVVTKTLVSGMRPLMLADDGIARIWHNFRLSFGSELQVKLQLVLLLDHQLPQDQVKLPVGQVQDYMLFH